MRKLPPLNAVRAFEAAARHVSFSKAARELFVTHGAALPGSERNPLRLAGRPEGLALGKDPGAPELGDELPERSPDL